MIRPYLPIKRKLSPRMRGCFQRLHARRADYPAFPAYAGMFLCSCGDAVGYPGFPRVCGDVSFETAAYVARYGFPRVCGDVSHAKVRTQDLCVLSPRMRGCFCFAELWFGRLGAFPAYAGMFPCCFRSRSLFGGFPRVCGDVSETHQGDLPPGTLSPRMRGCFQAVLNKEIYAQAFPAYAGMFLQSRPSW